MKRIFWLIALVLAAQRGMAQQLPPPVELTGAEYFWDTDPGFGNGKPITAGSTAGEVSLADLSVDFSGLQPGFHNFYIRFKDSSNRWGIPVRYTYYLPAEEPPAAITRAEYFVDTRPAEGSGSAITTTQVIEENATVADVSISGDAYTKGFRRLYLRFGDANGWGIPIRHDFYNPAERPATPVTRAEYFYDNLGTPGNGTSIPTGDPADEVVYNGIGLDLTGNAGFRRFFFRLGDATTWGIPVRASFYLPAVRDSARLTAAEYFFDTNPGSGTGSPLEVTEGTTINLNQGIPLTGVNPGFRNLYIRFKDAQGQWGIPARHRTYVPQARPASASVSAMEFFFSGTAAPAPGNGNALEPVDGTFNGFEEQAAALTRITAAAGNRAVYVRTRDASLQWGIPAVQPFTVSNQRVIEGQLYLPNGTDSVATAGLFVHLMQNGAVIDVDTTDFKGFFSFENLPAGTYQVRGAGVVDPVTGIQAVSPMRTFTLAASAPDVKTTSGVIRTPAAVVSVSGGRNGMRRELTDAIRVRYNNRIVPNTADGKVTLRTTHQGVIPVSVSFENNDSVLVATPSKPLAPGTEVILTVGQGLRSVNGSDVMPFINRGFAKVRRGVREFTGFKDIDSDPQNQNMFIVMDIAVGDLDGDGDNDVVSLNRYNRASNYYDSLVYRFNTGTGNMENRRAQRIYAAEGATLNAIVGQPRLESVDWDKDGDIDLITVGNVNSTAYFSLYVNDGRGRFTQSGSATPGASSTYVDYAIGDVDHNGFPDIVFTVADSRLMGITNQGGGQIGSVSLIHQQTGLYTNAMVSLADFSNDGITDLIVNNRNNRSIMMVPGNGMMWNAASIRSDSLISYASNINPLDLESLDWNDDGYMDLYGLDDANIMEWRNNRRFTGLTPTSTSRMGLSALGLYPTNGGSHQFGDIDNDGIPDLVHTLTSGNTSYVTAVQNTAQLFGHGGTYLITNNSTEGPLNNPRLADMDGDGDLDIIVSRYNSSFGKGWVRVYTNAAVSTNRAPVLAGGSDLRSNREITIGTPFVRNLTTDFSDADLDPLTFTASSGSSSIATVSVSGSSLTVTGVSAGTTTISLIANDMNGGIANVTFRIYVSPPGNRVPRLVTAIRDTSLRQADPAMVLNIGSAFTDPDGTQLSFSVSNDNSAAGTATIVNSNQLRFQPLTIGSSLLTVTASDGALSTAASFRISVTENVNRAPVVSRALRDTTILASQAAAYTISLPAYFSDPDQNTLTFSAVSNSTSIATVSVNALTGTLTVTPSTTTGTATITVTAQDPGGLSVQDQFTVTKNNRAPVLVKAFRDTTMVPAVVAPYTLNLTDFFSEPDGETMTYTVSTSSSAVATVQLLSSPARIQVTPTTTVGTATITVRATDPLGLFVQSSFTVTKGNRTPVLTRALRDTTLVPSSGSYEITLSQYFNDPDGDVLTFQANTSNNSVASVSILSSPSRLRVTAGSTTATANITVTAQDPSGLSVSDVFVVTVRGAPQTLVSLTEIHAVANQNPAVSYGMSTLFSDPGTSVTTLQTEFTTSDANVATMVRWTSSLIYVQTLNPGTAIVTVRARRSSDMMWSQTLSLSVRVSEQSFEFTESDTEGSYYEDGIPARKWTLFSVPVVLNSPSASTLFDELTGKDPFKLFQLNQDGSYQEVAGSQLDFAFQQQYSAYWFKTLAKKSSFTLKTAEGYRSQNRQYNGFYGIGWRLVSVPFDAPVKWTPAGNNPQFGNPRLWRYNEDTGAWVQLSTSEQLLPWGAYLYHSTTYLGILMSLPDGVQSTAKEVPLVQPVPEWAGRITVDGSAVLFGEAREAQDGWDAFDYPMLPAAPDDQSLRVFWKSEAATLSSDFRSQPAHDTERAERAHKLFVPAGSRLVSYEEAGASDNRSMLIHGNGVYAVLKPGESRQLLFKTSGYVNVHSGNADLLERVALPLEAALFDAFPNPFNPSTSIRFAVPAAGHVQVQVYDVTGRQVATLANRSFDAGYHVLRFDASTLSSGVYLYRMTFNGQLTSTRKMMLVK